MRVVLDTNLVVRAARRRASLARSILLESLSDRHTLILSNSLYFEIYKVMYYERVRTVHGLNDEGIAEFLDALVEAAVLVATHPIGPGPLIVADPQDDHVLLTAMAGRAELLGTNNRHFFTTDVQQIAAAHGIRAVRDVELIHELRKS
jgi:putative PIN family toxin of toxin-antitoxin system